MEYSVLCLSSHVAGRKKLKKNLCWNCLMNLIYSESLTYIDDTWLTHGIWYFFDLLSRKMSWKNTIQSKQI